MKQIKRLFISDIHMGDANSARVGEGQRPYGWLSPKEAQVLGDFFLRSDVVKEADQLIVVGDLLDLWVYPVDVKPPTVRDVLAAPHNQPVISALRDFAKTPGKELFYLPGNHDMSVDVADARDLVPEVKFRPFFADGPIHATHGHEHCLFNGVDPTGRPFPLGYFIARCTATADRVGGNQPRLDLWTVLKGAPEVVQMLKGKRSLAQAVIDVVCERTGVPITTSVVMPDGRTVGLSEVRDAYKNLTDEWNERKTTHAATAIACEWDPWANLSGGPRINIMGHSHSRVFAMHDYYGAYMNLGTWTIDRPNFGYTYVDADDESRLWVELCSWRAGSKVVDHRQSFKVT